MRQLRIEHRVSGYNLTEILVVIAIIGILILIALPDQTSTISKAKAVEAKSQLQHVHALQKMYFYEKSKYSENLEQIGFEQVDLVSNGGNANFVIEIVHADITGFQAEATAIVDFDGDGEFNKWVIDERKNLIELHKD